LNGLLKEALCRGTSKLITEYTYLFETTRYRKDKTGYSETLTDIYEVYAPPLQTGRLTTQIPVLISRNGTPVPPKELEKERQRAGEKLERAEREAQGQAGESSSFIKWCSGITPVGTYFTFIVPGEAREGKLRFTPLSVLRLSVFDSPRYEDLGGRRMIALNFRPRDGVSYEGSERYLAKLVGTIWIDAREKIAARIEAWPMTGDKSMKSTIDAHVAMGLGPAVVYEQIRLPDGTWLPKKIQLNTRTYDYVFGRYHYDMVNVFTEHKRFTTSVDEVKTEPSEKNP
jgi:hypothetical protein